MKWISVKDDPIPMGMVIVTNGKSLGYCIDIHWYSIVDTDDYLDGYISGIPDSNSFEMTGRDITHWLVLPELPKPD